MSRNTSKVTRKPQENATGSGVLQCATHLSTEGFFLRVEPIAEPFVLPHQNDEFARGDDRRILAVLDRLPTRLDESVTLFPEAQRAEKDCSEC